MTTHFIEDVRKGTARLEDINTSVEAWHSGQGAGQTLAEFLGMTPGQYARWVACPETLTDIVRETPLMRRHGNLCVELTCDAYDYNEVYWTLEVTEMDGEEGVENDAEPSYLPRNASGPEVDVYLEAALRRAVEWAGPETNVRNASVYAAAAGFEAANALKECA